MAYPEITSKKSLARISFDARSSEKQASRDADTRALARGEKTVEQLRHENSFALPPSDATIDYRSIRRARLR
jgi:hypothetical protein